MNQDLIVSLDCLGVLKFIELSFKFSLWLEKCAINAESTI